MSNKSEMLRSKIFVENLRALKYTSIFIVNMYGIYIYLTLFSVKNNQYHYQSDKQNQHLAESVYSYMSRH